MMTEDQQNWLDATPKGEARTLHIVLEGVGERSYTQDRRDVKTRIREVDHAHRDDILPPIADPDGRQE